MSFPISTSIHWTFDNNFKNGFYGIKDVIERIAAAGFRYEDFNFCDHTASSKSPFLGAEWENYIDYVGDVATKCGVQFNQAHAPCNDGVWVDGITEDDKLKYIERAIVACSKLGIPQMVYHPLLFSTNPDWENVNREFFNPIIELSHKYNIGVAVENLFAFHDCPLSKPDCLIEFVDSFNDPLVGICWDTGHGNFIKGDKNLERYTDQYAMLTKIGKRLRALHIHDNYGMADEHMPPFDGNINWKDVMRALYDIDYKYSFTYESHNAINRIPEECKDVIEEKMKYMYILAKTLVSDEFIK